jgi:hypothetical protein
MTVKWWNGYWFRPAPYVDLALVRLFAVACQLWLLLAWGKFSSETLEALWALPEPLYDPITLLRLFLLPWGWEYRPSPQFMAIVFYVSVVAGLLAFVGFRTRLSLLVFALTNAFLVAYAYSHGDFHHTEAPLIIALGILALSPAGRVLSVDQLIRRWRGGSDEDDDILTAESPLAGWPIRLVQWLFVLIYLSAVLSKLVFEGGLDWLNGYTLQYYMIQDTLRKGTLLGGWFSQHHYLVMLSQYLVVIFQTTFALAVMFPRLRWIYVPLGLGFHAGNWILLNAAFPEWMALYAVFIPWRHVFTRMLRREPEGRRDPQLAT